MRFKCSIEEAKSYIKHNLARYYDKLNETGATLFLKVDSGIGTTFFYSWKNGFFDVGCDYDFIEHCDDDSVIEYVRRKQIKRRFDDVEEWFMPKEPKYVVVGEDWIRARYE